MDVIEGGAGVPAEPDWAKIYKLAIDRASASSYWRDVIAEMKTLQTLAIVNGAAIKRLVIFHVEFERQARAIAKGGAVRAAKKTKVPQIHPSWSVMKQAAELVSALEAELAISPRRRNNGGKTKRSDASGRPANGYLKPVAR